MKSFDDTKYLSNQPSWKFHRILQFEHQKNEQKKLQSRERIVAAFNHGSIIYSWWTALGRSSLKKQTNLTVYLETEQNRSNENYKMVWHKDEIEEEKEEFLVTFFSDLNNLHYITLKCL